MNERPNLGGRPKRSKGRKRPSVSYIHLDAILSQISLAWVSFSTLRTESWNLALLTDIKLEITKILSRFHRVYMTKQRFEAIILYLTQFFDILINLSLIKKSRYLKIRNFFFFFVVKKWKIDLLWFKPEMRGRYNNNNDHVWIREARKRKLDKKMLSFFKFLHLENDYFRLYRKYVGRWKFILSQPVRHVIFNSRTRCYWRFICSINLKNVFFQNCVGGKFFEIFFKTLPKSPHQEASIELLFV